jgi:hypothetical protein
VIRGLDAKVSFHLHLAQLVKSTKKFPSHLEIRVQRAKTYTGPSSGYFSPLGTITPIPHYPPSTNREYFLQILPLDEAPKKGLIWAVLGQSGAFRLVTMLTGPV